MITYSDTGIADPRLTFDRGVAAVDLITLRRWTRPASASGR